MIQVARKLATPLDYAALPREELVERIAARKAELNAVILGHNYQRIDIQEVSDYLGDSLGLSQEAARTDADVIVFCGVHFMAETAKVLSPDKMVLMPDLRAGCPMADFVTGDALRRLKARHPDAAVVAYVNSTAEVKAESDVCCTSANAVEVVNSIPADRTILFVPDRNLARHVAEQVPEKTIIPWEGFCYVHQQITPQEIERIRQSDPDLEVLVHPECRADVARLANAVLSTSGMVKYAKERPATRFLVVTECGLSDRLAMEVPNKTFLKGCKLCTFMKVTTLEDVRDSLQKMQYEIEVPEDVRLPAERALRRMFEATEGGTARSEVVRK